MPSVNPSLRCTFPRRSLPSRLLTLLPAVTVLVILALGAGTAAAQPDSRGHSGEGTVPSLGVVDAVILGVVEGITEFLPVSSTGHLLVTGRLLGLDDGDAAGEAFNAYAIAIQAGAIVAVIGLYRRRIATMVAGLAGRDPAGRNLVMCLAVAFVPAAVIGLAFEAPIKDRLFQPWAIAVAWAVGGVVILLWQRRRAPSADRGLPLERLTVRLALIVGVAQSFALWPGTSRSLVTILAALAVGLKLSAAVELSFLLGLLTLGAATAYEALVNGGTMIDAYGVGMPLLGLLAALVSAALAVTWMVGWLQKRGLAVFGWYRLGAAATTALLIATGTLDR